jgi:hypothetical protein
MRFVCLPCLLLLGACVSSALPEPPVDAPLTEAGEERILPGTPTDAQIRDYVEGAVLDRFGAEAVRAANRAASSIMAASIRGRFGTGGPAVNVAIRGPDGWVGPPSGTQALLSPAASREIDRILADQAFWAESNRFPAYDCPDSGAHLLVVRHRGRAKITRQSCEPANLVGLLLRTVLAEAPPA